MTHSIRPPSASASVRYIETSAGDHDAVMVGRRSGSATATTGELADERSRDLQGRGTQSSAYVDKPRGRWPLHPIPLWVYSGMMEQRR